jgi:hypothetical protein
MEIELSAESLKLLQEIIRTTVSEEIEKRTVKETAPEPVVIEKKKTRARATKPKAKTPKKAVTVKKKATISEDFKVKKPDEKVKRRPVHASGVNEFFDDGLEEQDGLDAKIKKIKTPRNRPAVKMVEVICNGCGSKETMPTSQITSTTYHRCSKCVGR